MVYDTGERFTQAPWGTVLRYREDANILSSRVETTLWGFYIFHNGSSRLINQQGAAYYDGELVGDAVTTFQGQTMERAPTISPRQSLPKVAFITNGNPPNPRPADATTMQPYSTGGTTRWVDERGSLMTVYGDWEWQGFSSAPLVPPQQVPIRWLTYHQTLRMPFTLAAAPYLVDGGRQQVGGELWVDITAKSQPQLQIKPDTVGAPSVTWGPTRWEQIGTDLWRAKFQFTNAASYPIVNGEMEMWLNGGDGEEYLVPEVYRALTYTRRYTQLSLTVSPANGESPLWTTAKATVTGEEPITLKWAAPAAAESRTRSGDTFDALFRRPGNHGVTVTATDAFGEVTTNTQNVGVVGRVVLEVEQRNAWVDFS